jgi:hypothetical protein
MYAIVQCKSSMQKRMFAKYWDHVDDPRDISGASRFMSGGIGGITSQLSMSISSPVLCNINCYKVFIRWKPSKYIPAVLPVIPL